MNNRKLLTDAFNVVFENQRRFLEALIIPFLMLLILDLTVLLDVPVVLGWLFELFGVLIYASFAVVTHRLVILGDDSVPKYGLTSISRRELLFIGYTIGIPVVLALPVFLVVTQLSATTGTVVVVIFMSATYLYVLARSSLVYPGTAIDKWITIPRSWAMTQGHQASIFIAVIVFPMLLGLLMTLPTMVLDLVLPYGVMVLVNSLVSTFLLIFTITILSLAYKEITDSEAES